MKSLLTELQDNNAVLLMYLSDELPAADRAEVEQMLASDASLRAQLEELIDAQRVATAAIAAADGKYSPAAQSAALRKTTSVIRQWQVDRFARPASAPARRLRIPAWTYPAAAAAMLFVAFFIWWGSQKDDSGVAPAPPVAVDTTPSNPVAPDVKIASDDDPGDAEHAGVAMDDLSRMEREMNAVVTLREMIR